MKIDRQIGILSVLLQKEIVSAPCLAEIFEVSRRTINRDVEDLCKAGIPIATKQGANGGVSIIENYKFDRTFFTRQEMKDILAGLRSLDSVNKTNRYGQLMEKLSAGSSDFMTGDQTVLIDLSSWYKDSLAPKIEQIRACIDKRKKLEFVYFSSKGESARCVEPYYLIFRWANWYVWGWCEKRRDFRLFKLNRMDKLKISSQEFLKRPSSFPNLSDEKVFPGGIKIKALFEPDCKWRLIEEFGAECFCERQDGKLLFQSDYTNKNNLLAWILSFGEKAELLEPKEIREKIKISAERMRKKYESEI